MKKSVGGAVGWQAKRFDAFAVLQRGFDLPSTSRKSGRIPVIGSNGIVGWHDTARVHGPGVATGRSGSIGESIFSEADFWPLNTALYISNFHGNVPQFVHYFLKWFDLSRFQGGVSVPTLNRNMVHDAEVLVPPKDEQEKIAAILWKLQRAIATQDRLIATTRDLKQSAMAHLFTHGLRGEALKETEIGPMPESWNPVHLGDVCTLSTGTTPATKDKHYYEGEVPFIKTADIVNNRISTANTYVSKQAVVDYSLKLFPPGTVLMAMYGQGKTRGQVSLLEFGAATTQNAGAIQPSNEMDPVFLWQYLMSCYDRLREMGSLGHISHLNLGYLRDLVIVKPPLIEQRDIGATLTTIDRKLTHHQKKRAALNDLFQTLLHKLMSAEIRVVDLDIDTSEVAAPAADHFVDVNKMISTRKKTLTQ